MAGLSPMLTHAQMSHAHNMPSPPVLTASHSFMSSPAGSRTASSTAPVPSVCSMCCFSVRPLAPTGTFLTDRNVPPFLGVECKGDEEAGKGNGRAVVEVVVVVNGPGAGAAAGGGLNCQRLHRITAQSENQPCSTQPSLAETEEARHRAATERRRFGCARGGSSCAAGS